MLLRIMPRRLDRFTNGGNDVHLPRFYLDLRGKDIASALRTQHLKRAIGVIYRPDTELISHYSMRDCPISSMPSFTLITRGPWNRWNAPPNGRWAK